MKKYLIFVILFLFLIQNVNADIISPGDKPINYCIDISNLEQYDKDFQFLLPFEFSNSYRTVKRQTEKNCFIKGGRLNTIYAITTDDFTKNVDIVEGDSSDDTFKLPDDKTLSNFIIKSGIKLNPISIVAKNDPLEKAIDVFEITKLDNKNFELKKSKVIYVYTDGTSEEKPYVSQEVRPEPSKKAILPWWFAEFWFVILPFLALIIIIGIIIYKRRK